MKSEAGLFVLLGVGLMIGAFAMHRTVVKKEVSQAEVVPGNKVQSTATGMAIGAPIGGLAGFMIGGIGIVLCGTGVGMPAGMGMIALSTGVGAAGGGLLGAASGTSSSTHVTTVIQQVPYFDPRLTAAVFLLGCGSLLLAALMAKPSGQPGAVAEGSNEPVG